MQRVHFWLTCVVQKRLCLSSLKPRERVLNKFLGTRDFPSLKLEIRGLKAKSGRDSGLKVCLGGERPKITLRITGLHEIVGRDYGIDEPYWEPSREVLTHLTTKTFKS